MYNFFKSQQENVFLLAFLTIYQRDLIFFQKLRIAE